MGRLKYYFKQAGKLTRYAIAETIHKNKPSVFKKNDSYYDELQFITPRKAALEAVSREIYNYQIDGNVAEAGVYRGDFAKYINALFLDRKLYLIDTFDGFDNRDVEVDKINGYSKGNQDFSDTDEWKVLKKMIYPNNCIIKKGYFPVSMQNVTDKFCFVSLDMDLYEPTFIGLNWFWEKLSPGGYIFVHDCRNETYKGSKQAVIDFCRNKEIGYFILPDPEGSAVLSKGKRIADGNI